MWYIPIWCLLWSLIYGLSGWCLVNALIYRWKLSRCPLGFILNSLRTWRRLRGRYLWWWRICLPLRNWWHWAPWRRYFSCCRFPYPSIFRYILNSSRCRPLFRYCFGILFTYLRAWNRLQRRSLYRWLSRLYTGHNRIATSLGHLRRWLLMNILFWRLILSTLFWGWIVARLRTCLVYAGWWCHNWHTHTIFIVWFIHSKCCHFILYLKFYRFEFMYWVY